MRRALTWSLSWPETAAVWSPPPTVTGSSNWYTVYLCGLRTWSGTRDLPRDPPLPRCGFSSGLPTRFQTDGRGTWPSARPSLRCAHHEIFNYCHSTSNVHAAARENVLVHQYITCTTYVLQMLGAGLVLGSSSASPFIVVCIHVDWS